MWRATGRTLTEQTSRQGYRASAAVVNRLVRARVSYARLSPRPDLQLRTGGHRRIRRELSRRASARDIGDGGLAASETTAMLVFAPTQAGEYEIACTIPEQQEAGMVGKFVVTQ